MDLGTTHIQVSEVFLSIQGESSFAGWPCVFVRTSGCPLCCVWCDTRFANVDGDELTVETILERVLAYGVEHVELTGGEPLAQAGSFDLLSRLCDRQKTVLLETSGHLDIGPVDPRVHIIMDVKCPASGMSDTMHLANFARIGRKDEVKFVLASRADYEFARDVIQRERLAERAGNVLLSTVFGTVAPREVVAWILADRLPARFQLQLHKLIWDPTTRGV